MISTNADYEKTLKKASKSVETYFLEHCRPELTFHNLKHTRYVVRAVERIAAHSHLSNDDLFVVMAAAWFRETGYLTAYEEPAVTSAGLAVNFLKEEGIDQPLISMITDLIRVEQRNMKPGLTLEGIILDAETYELGKKSFVRKTELLRKERQLISNKHIEKNEWNKQTIAFLEKHEYYSSFSRALLTNQKVENLFHLKALVVQHDHGLPPESLNVLSKTTDSLEKSIDTAFAIAAQNNQHLSSLADNKAHILITVNSIILSALISLLIRKLQESTYLTFPTFLLLSINLFTIVLAIIENRPTLRKGTFSQGDLTQKKINLLFFGNYFKMQPDQFTKGMWMMLDDKVYIYNSIMLDIYYQGTVIGRKYHYLRLA
jgi:predicted metal-dependent HD superfamily phosphohydrolase